jgi:hypothetical protein
MARTVSTEKSSESTPKHYAETVPTAFPSYDPSFSLQSILEMQKNLGQLTQAVTTLTEESKKRGDVLDKISHKVYAAEVVIGVVGVILTAMGGGLIYLICKVLDVIVPLIQLKPHP